MTPERLKCAVREAPQRRPLLENVPVNTFPLKRVTRIGRPMLGNLPVNTPGHNRGYPLLGNGCFLGVPCQRVITENEGRLLSRFCVSSETVKYGRDYQENRTQERLLWQGPAAYIKDRPVLSSERAPLKKTRP
jgi:hypothetical protein